MGSWEPDREPEEELEGQGQPGTKPCPCLHCCRLQPGPSGCHLLTEQRGLLSPSPRPHSHTDGVSGL